jgi:hypothetical protein
MHPHAHRSTGALYEVDCRSTSGARYQRVETYSVKGGRDRISRARPKSHTCNRGLRSSCHSQTTATLFTIAASPLNIAGMSQCADGAVSPTFAKSPVIMMFSGFISLRRCRSSGWQTLGADICENRPVKIALFVHVSDALEDLEHIIPDSGFWERFWSVFHTFIHVFLHKFKN